MGYICPYCNMVCFDDNKITDAHYLAHGVSNFFNLRDSEIEKADTIVLHLSKCPNCGKTALSLSGYYKNPNLHCHFSYPPKGMKQFPEYIPEAIRNDYKEAVSIVELSPKAAATLARRCLQGMIHDFWGIKEKNLNAEITSLKTKVTPTQWAAMDGLRKIGNIGAHMEKDVELIIDVDPEEAKKLIQLIELLIDKWYIARHDEEELLANISEIASEKESLRADIVSGQ